MAVRTRDVAIAVSAYDRAAGWVIAWNVLMGLSVGLLFLFWLSRYHGIEFAGGEPTPSVPGTYVSNDNAIPFMDVPTGEELEEAAAPDELELLPAVTEVVTQQAAALDDLPTVSHSNHVRRGDGEGRLPGGADELNDTIPPGQRWQIRYSSKSLETYRQQLDHFGIELGVVGGGVSHIDYAWNLRLTRPESRRAAGGRSEQRLYMLWTTGALRRFDERILRDARIPTAGRIVLQFYPESVEQDLKRIELDFARDEGKVSVTQIQKTTFGVRKTATGFEYHVISQEYR